MFNFPLYAIRAFISKFKEGKYTVIQGRTRRYVIDVESEEDNYLARRMIILRDVSSPYPIYPLKYRVDNISQLAVSTKRNFIDSKGNIIRWKPSKYYPVVCLKVKSSWNTTTGKTVLEVFGSHTKFIIEGPPTKYVQVIKFNNRHILFDTCNEYRKSTRKKL